MSVSSLQALQNWNTLCEPPLLRPFTSYTNVWLKDAENSAVPLSLSHLFSLNYLSLSLPRRPPPLPAALSPRCHSPYGAATLLVSCGHTSHDASAAMRPGRELIGWSGGVGGAGVVGGGGGGVGGDCAIDQPLPGVRSAPWASQVCPCAAHRRLSDSFIHPADQSAGPTTLAYAASCAQLHVCKLIPFLDPPGGRWSFKVYTHTDRGDQSFRLMHLSLFFYLMECRRKTHLLLLSDEQVVYFDQVVKTFLAQHSWSWSAMNSPRASPPIPSFPPVCVHAEKTELCKDQSH